MSTARQEVIKHWWAKALASLESCDRELGAGNLDFAINRVYYAAFYAVSTPLLANGFSFRKHSGVRAAFHREIISRGALPQHWGRLYDRWLEDRQEGDYIALASFEHDYVYEQMISCREFVSAVEQLLKHSIAPDDGKPVHLE